MRLSLKSSKVVDHEVSDGAVRRKGRIPPLALWSVFSQVLAPDKLPSLPPLCWQDNSRT